MNSVKELMLLVVVAIVSVFFEIWAYNATVQAGWPYVETYAVLSLILFITLAAVIYLPDYVKRKR